MQLKTFIPYILFFLILLGISAALTYSALDPDFGWHLKSGELILERGIPYQDWYTYTMPNFPWINHEWLMDVGMFAAYTVVGFRGLQLLFLVIFTASFFLIKKQSWPFWAFVVPVFLAYMASVDFLGVRPQLFTVFFVAILLAIIDRFLDNKSRVVWFLPFLFLAWVNLHASFFAGLFILSVVLACELFKKTPLKNVWILKDLNYQEKSWQVIGQLAAITVISGLVTLANPYGIYIYEELFRTIGDNYLRFHIAEWFPLFLSGFKPLICMYIGIVGACILLLFKKAKFNYLVLSAGFLVLSFSSIRYFLLFAIISLPLVIEACIYFGGVVTKERLQMAWQHPSWVYRIISVMPVVLLLASFGIYAGQIIQTKIEDSGASYYPDKAIPFVAAMPASEKIFNEYGWGGYIIWKIPDRKVFIDGRMPSWRHNGQFVFKDYIDITDANPGFDKMLEKYGVTAAFIPHNKLAGELKGLGWQVVYQDETAIVLKKP